MVLMTQSPFKKSLNQRLLKFIESKRKVVLTTYSVKSFLRFGFYRSTTFL